MNNQIVGVSFDTLRGGLPPFVIALGIFLGLLILVPAWLLLARSRFLSGDSDVTTLHNRTPQLYGYTVCLVTLITAMLSISSIVDNVFRLRDPLRADERWSPFEPSLDSFEAYKATYQRSTQFSSASDRTVPAETPPDEVLRGRYEALRADRIGNVRFAAQRGLTTSTLILVIALGLFGVHWWWLKRRVEVVAINDQRAA